MEPQVKPPIKPSVKPILQGYKLITGYVVGGIVITAIVIVAATNWHSWFDKPKTTDQNQTQAPAQTDPLAQFNGEYTGTSSANQGITSATANVSSGNISGTANYVGGGTTVVLTVTGTVDASGNVAGSLSGSGSAEGQTATVTGTYSGTISGNSMNVKYNGSGGGYSSTGSIVLTKK